MFELNVFFTLIHALIKSPKHNAAKTSISGRCRYMTAMKKG